MNQRWNPLNRLWGMQREGRLPSSLSSAVSDSDPGHVAFLREMTKELHHPSSALMPLEGLEIVVVDLETTGFQAYHGDEIISIGAVAMKGTEILDQENFSSYVNPNRQIPEHIQRLTGISPTILSVAPDLLSTLSRFFQFVQNRPLVAHHSRHEREFFQAALWKTSRTKLTHRLLDTMMLIRLCEGLVGDGSLDSLCNRNHIQIEKRHDAYHDALATAKLWSIYIERTIQKGYVSLQEVYQHMGGRRY